jgi:L-threonylcarbamoyladenylate synthase
MSHQLTTIIRLGPGEPDDALLKPAADALRRGELVAFPTETVYGLGANALDPCAVAKIFEAKGRPADNPLIVHIASIDGLAPLVREISPLARKLFEHFSPGPLTLIMPKSPLVPDQVTAGLDTVAVRIPSHPVARRLIELAGVPVAAPSANRSGRPSPTRGWHVAADLTGRIAYIIESGISQYGLESTVVDVTGTVPVILRPGAIPESAIMAATGLPDAQHEPGSQERAAPRSPGMKYRHYAPKARVLIAEADDADARYKKISSMAAQLLADHQKVGIFMNGQAVPYLQTPFSELDLAYFAADWSGAEKGVSTPDGGLFAVIYAAHPDATKSSAALFDALRCLDSLGVTAIIAEGLPDQGMGTAYMNRLRKAAAPPADGEDPTVPSNGEGPTVPADGEGQPARAEDENQVASGANHCLILFVCTGNTCRSPMAALLFNHLNRKPGWYADSAGMAAIYGERVSSLAVAALELNFSIDLSGHRARPLTIDLLNEASRVVTMTTAQKDALRRGFPGHRDRIFTIGEMAGEPQWNVSDPYGGDLRQYEETAALLASLIEKLIDRLP